jgi:sugar O-acyltransferase (sialic acid O-acetyltransferase NeuD family)
MYPPNADKDIALIGYSGHAYVVKDVFDSMQRRVSAFCEKRQPPANPFSLQFLGDEGDEETLARLQQYDYFVAVGDNASRRRISRYLLEVLGRPPLDAIDASAVVSRYARLAPGVLVAPRVVINTLVEVGEGVICNTGAILEHECRIGAYTHIAPGAVLCGNIIVGEESLIGANAVIMPGLRIGARARIGAGAVIVKDVGEGEVVVGNGRVL